MTSDFFSTAPLPVAPCGVRADGTWWWSEPVFLLLGLAPGDVVPTAEALVAHVHPGDRPAVRTMLSTTPPPGERPVHEDARLVRVVGFDGVEQLVVLHVVRAVEGRLSARFVALGAPYVAAVRAATNAQLADALGSRAPIDQAKGVLAAVRGYADDEAFDVLRAASQRGNVRLRTVAEQVVGAASPRRPGLASRIDDLLGPERASDPGPQGRAAPEFHR